MYHDHGLVHDQELGDAVVIALDDAVVQVLLDEVIDDAFAQVLQPAVSNYPAPSALTVYPITTV